MKNRLLLGLDLEIGDTIFIPEFCDRPHGNYFPSLVLSIFGPYEEVSMGKSDGKYLVIAAVAQTGVRFMILHESWAWKYVVR